MGRGAGGDRKGILEGESLVGAQALSGCAISKPLDQREYDHGSPRLEHKGGAVSGAAVSS